MTIEELRQQINALIFTNIEKLISGDKVNIIMHYITDVIEEHIDNHDIHVTTQNKTNWNTAYGWGDHHGLYSDVNHNHELSKLLDIDDKDKDVGKILKVGLDGKTHEYVVDEEGTDEKIKYDSDDTTADYLSEKIIAGTNISLSEGTGPNENKLKINNTYTHPDTHPLSIIDESAIATDTPIDASRFHFWDTINNLWKAITWNNIKSTLKTYFDGIYGTLGLEHEQNTDTELICHGSVIDNFEEYENTADMKKNWTSQGPVISLPVISLDDTESYEGEKSMKVVGGLGESYDFDSCNIFINNGLFGQIGLNIAQDWKKYNFNLSAYIGQRIFSFMIVLISANGDEFPIYTSIPDFGDDFWNKSHDLEFWIKTGAAGSKTAWIDNITFDGESDKVITACEIRDHFENNTGVNTGDQDLSFYEQFEKSNLEFDKVTKSDGDYFFNYKAGRIRNDNEIFEVSAGDVEIVDDDTNYIEVNDNGVIAVNQTGFTESAIPLYKCVMASGESTIIDKRTRLIVGGGGGHEILNDGVPMPQRSKLNFVGCEITDDSGNDTTDVKIEVINYGNFYFY